MGSSEITHTVPIEFSNLLKPLSGLSANHSTSTYFHVRQRTNIPVSQNPIFTSTHQPFPIRTESHTKPLLSVTIPCVQKSVCAGIPYSEPCTIIYRGDMSSVWTECNRVCSAGIVQQGFRRAIAKRPNADTLPFASDEEMTIGGKTERPVSRLGIQTCERKSRSFSCNLP